MATLFGALSLMFVSCQPGDVWLEDSVEPKLRVGTNPLDKAASSQFLNVTASGDWTISVTYPEVENKTEDETVDEWLSVSPTSGKDSKSSVILQWSANSGEESREVTLTLHASGKFYDLKLTQKGVGSGSGSTISFEPKSGWLELPEVIDDDGHDFFYHTMTIGSVEARNYSFYYSYGDYLALWVAYPLCAWNIGSSVGRTDAWGLDPLLPRDKQAVLYHGFGRTNYEWTKEDQDRGEFFARGHQIPSADRLTSYDSNSMTFYSTNMTPQRNKAFNSTIWANLEGKVRKWAKECDTLYVVTGCVVDGSTYYCLDNDGKKVTIPTAYFKACLSYSKRISEGIKGYRSIAVWMNHREEYTDSYVSTGYALSVSELEERLGYRLFVNLDDKVGEADAKAIKDSKSTSWWW